MLADPIMTIISIICVIVLIKTKKLCVHETNYREKFGIFTLTINNDLIANQSGPRIFKFIFNILK